MTEQYLLWVDAYAPGQYSALLEWAGPRPRFVWSLFSYERNRPPEIPLEPIHMLNGFLEDYIHDWVMVPGKPLIKYFSRVSTGGHWLLLEME